MTGECWDHGVNKDGYYTQGGFDSMINFSTQGGGLLSAGRVKGTYDGFAKAINNDDSSMFFLMYLHTTLFSQEATL